MENNFFLMKDDCNFKFVIIVNEVVTTDVEMP